jgi:hypothetical protein
MAKTPEQKYTNEQYEDAGYFEMDDEHTHNEYKVVTTRKEHTCISVDGVHPIPKGSRAIRETAIHCDAGRVSCYLCLPCCDKWLDTIHGESE